MRNFTSFLLGAAALLAAGAAEAKVTKIVIDSRAPAFNNQAFGAVGAYEMLRGRAFGEVDPADKHNTVIQDIGLAPKNARGHVEYIATFTLIKPVDAAKGNGVLFYDLANRGRSLRTSLNVGERAGDEVGDGFFYNRGYTMLSSGWQGDVVPMPTADKSVAGSEVESVTVPKAKNPDGSPIIGPFLVRIPTLGPEGPSGDMTKLDQGRAGALAYPPATFDTAKATLTGSPAETIRGVQNGAKLSIPGSDWMWANCETKSAANATTPLANLCIKLSKGTFNPKWVYTLVFPAKDPMVMGLGLAATRDIISFFRYGQKDDAGTANPVSGAIKNVIGQGVSQSGNTAKTFIALGFNEDEAGKIVWDGANAHIAGRFAPINYRFAVPGGSATMYAPGSEAAVWWTPLADPIRHQPALSMLDRCTASNTCPKIFETFGGIEMWNQRMSLGMVGPEARRDIPIPANVRRYYFPGTSHGGGEGGFRIGAATPKEANSTCTLPLNPNPEKESMRALMVALTAWTVSNTEPPQSKYPTLADGQLTAPTEGALKFPTIPGVPKPFDLVNPVLVYDFGPHFVAKDVSGYIDYQPPQIRQVLPARVPQVDAEGIEHSGVASVLYSAPLGTYLGWNVTRAGVFAGQICSLVGGYMPFAKTQAERTKANDPRLSIEERYGDRQGYICAVQKAVKQSVKGRYLLEADGKRLVDEATAATTSGDLTFLPTASTAKGKALCTEAAAG